MSVSVFRRKFYRFRRDLRAAIASFIASLARELPPPAVRLTKMFSTAKNAPRVLYLGDSVVQRISRDDTDRRSLGKMVADDLKGTLRVGCLSHSAYHSAAYEALLKVVRYLPAQPQIVIMPVNIRSFSPQWDLSPEWQFNGEITRLQYYASYLAGREYSRQATKDFLSRVPKDNEDFDAFEKTQVDYPANDFKTIGDFRRLIASNPSDEEQNLLRLRQIFIYHYLHILQPDHRRLCTLVDILNYFAESDISLVLYSTPVNYQAGERLLGSAFHDVFLANLEIVRDTIAPFARKPNIFFEDATMLLESRHFFHENEPTEHLNQQGRRELSALLSKRTRQLKKMRFEN